MKGRGSTFSKKKDILLLVNKFGIRGPLSVYAVDGGAINDTYVIESAVSNDRYIFQKLHKIFSYEILYDFEAVTGCLASGGLLTPILVKTEDGDHGLVVGGDVWRMMTYIPGTTVKNSTPETAKSAGGFLACFHNALQGMSYELKHHITGFHDPGASIEKLKDTLSEFSQHERFKRIKGPADFVMNEFVNVKDAAEGLPLRIVHGDPKVRNFIFDESEKEALCLIDLDTVSNDHIIIDVGDALRSWCMVYEDGRAVIDKHIFKSFMEGYFMNAGFLTNREISAIIDGVKIVTLDLCSRYLTDAFKEEYFKLDYSKYDSLYEQNISKASGLVSFYGDISDNEYELAGVVEDCRGLSS